MGDRAVIGFKASKADPGIYLYSHWGGSNRHADAARALEAARPRWSDASYATRIAISTIVGESWNEETGYGLSVGPRSYAMPNYKEILVVVWEQQVVQIWDLDETKCRLELSFDAFIAAVGLEFTAH